MKTYPYHTPEGIIELVEQREYDEILKLALQLANMRAEKLVAGERQNATTPETKPKDMSLPDTNSKPENHKPPSNEGLAAVPCSAFVPEDRRFYWWRCNPDGHWLMVMVRNGLCLMPGFSRAHKVTDQKGEFWPAPLNPPSWPNTHTTP